MHLCQPLALTRLLGLPRSTQHVACGFSERCATQVALYGSMGAGLRTEWNSCCKEHPANSGTLSVAYQHSSSAASEMMLRALGNGAERQKPLTLEGGQQRV